MVLAMGGCAHKPNIPGYHWNGDNLYDKDGVSAAVMISGIFQPSMACVHHSPAHPEMERCTYWETDKQAYDYIIRAYSTTVDTCDYYGNVDEAERCRQRKVQP